MSGSHNIWRVCDDLVDFNLFNWLRYLSLSIEIVSQLSSDREVERTDPTILVALATAVHLTFYQHYSSSTGLVDSHPLFFLNLMGSEFYNKDVKYVKGVGTGGGGQPPPPQ